MELKFPAVLVCVCEPLPVFCQCRTAMMTGMARVFSSGIQLYRGADKSLARPGRKQATATKDFEFHISYL